MRYIAIAAFAAFALAGSASAQSFVGNYGTIEDVQNNNSFKSDLAALGLTKISTVGGSLNTAFASGFEIDLMGYENGFINGISTDGGVTFLDTWTGTENLFDEPLFLGIGGDITKLVFRTQGGAIAGIGSEGFGIFAPGSAVSGGAFNTQVLFIGFDDRGAGPDDNHDDGIVRLTAFGAGAPPAVPEPATWAMLIAGFGLVGASARRRRVMASVS